MFINGRGWDTNNGQRARGSFLMIADDPTGEDSSKLRALVRRVEMSQCGHFMMGHVTIKTPKGCAELTLSGGYGSDGLPMHLNHKGGGDCVWLWDYMHDVPDDLTEAFWAGGGHNAPGSEGPLLRSWALRNKQELTRLCKRKQEIKT